MKYAIWFVRLVFAAWMIPSGLNHFVPLFPQPMGTKPLSHELIVALLDSHLFDLVKAVEFIAGDVTFLDAHDAERLGSIRRHRESLAGGHDRADYRVAVPMDDSPAATF